jgi:hypothetical protein
MRSCRPTLRGYGEIAGYRSDSAGSWSDHETRVLIHYQNTASVLYDGLGILTNDAPHCRREGGGFLNGLVGTAIMVGLPVSIDPACHLAAV